MKGSRWTRARWPLSSGHSRRCCLSWNSCPKASVQHCLSWCSNSSPCSLPCIGTQSQGRLTANYSASFLNISGRVCCSLFCTGFFSVVCWCSTSRCRLPATFGWPSAFRGTMSLNGVVRHGFASDVICLPLMGFRSLLKYRSRRLSLPLIYKRFCCFYLYEP